ncbi:MAG: hypothetical protein FJ299_02320 [Planctomycetes bacterium]|nr:hypothetical protein [Planctomycetota bacterium]
MPAPPTDARTGLATAISVAACGDDGFVLRVRPDAPYPPIRASRFFMLRREDGSMPLVPRPFSIYRQLGAELEFLVKQMGVGTRALGALRPGDRLRVTGPLGNGWPALEPRPDEPWVMLAGGIGSAPFYMGIEQALSGMDGRPACRPQDLALLYGAARKGLLYDIAAFRQLGVRTFTATDDGSDGHRGNVLGLLEALQQRGELPRRVRLLACGPERMLEAVERHAMANGLECWLSLESLMGCGVGICNGCPVPTRKDGPLGAWSNAKCCVEGPVFSCREVELAHGRGS